MFRLACSSLLAFCLMAAADSAAAQPSVAAPSPSTKPVWVVWPRTFASAGNTLTMYQPQVDSWDDYSTLRFRAAIAVTASGSTQQHFGVIAVKADTLVDHESRTVFMANMDVAVRFPGLADQAQSDRLKSLVRECLPNLGSLKVALDQITAYMHGKSPIRTVNVNLDPPPIYYSDSPAILVVYMGQPQFKPITGTGLMFAVNTNWVVLMDTSTSQYFLLNGDSWYTSPDPLRGPWVAAQQLPAGFASLPEDDHWSGIRAHIPGTIATSVPWVLASPEPTELIITNGAPSYTYMPETRLLYVNNPTLPLFMDPLDSSYYYLVSGRWFHAQDVTGPWTAASATLPAEFAKIPPDSPVGFALASVPRTQEADDAVLLASIPQKATITISQVTLDVDYDGDPRFVPIPPTSMSYAVNSAYPVVLSDDLYYCCHQGAWFLSPTATGPWAICTSVPAVIYTIPPVSPLFNTTYVRVYGYTPTTVTVGYTGGYCGDYVAATGALVFGAGMLTGTLLAANDNCCWYGYNACFYSYGCAAHYSYAYGGYCRAGGACYGPHGGAGWGSSYDALAGTWTRAAYAYGPAGAHYGVQAFNPFTNTYAARAGGTTGYGSWGEGAVSRGDQWVSAAYASTSRGSAGWAENSSGQWAEGVHANFTDSSLARASNGDVYAGHDGNVYRKSDGQWQRYQGGGNWSDPAWNRAASPSLSQSTSSSDAYSTWQSGMQNRSAGTAENNWQSLSNTDEWKSNWENRDSDSFGQTSWGQYDTQRSLDQDSWARDQGTSNAFSSWQSRSSGSRWGDGGFAGFGGGGWGGGGRFRR
jgi:hypothetical protein